MFGRSGCGFRGGRGVATGARRFLADLLAGRGRGAIVVWILVVVFWRYVSLGSISAAAALPLLMYLLYAPGHAPPRRALRRESSGHGRWSSSRHRRQHRPAARRHRTANHIRPRATSDRDAATGRRTNR